MKSRIISEIRIERKLFVSILYNFKVYFNIYKILLRINGGHARRLSRKSYFARLSCHLSQFGQEEQ